ncbi:MAG TPA: DUF1929 domain-containing protein [Phycisphaerae bacterium]|nr:DUF1929 domain-containing protein [Phycisphaerae bacterium]
MNPRGTILVVAFLTTLSQVNAQDPSQDGQWTDPFPLPLIAIHAAMLPSGKVLLFSAEHGVPGIHGWLLNPSSIPTQGVAVDPDAIGLTNVPPPAGWNPDCAGHSFLPDGRLLVAGGTLSFNPLLGTRRAYIFDTWGEQWVRVADMASGRWYPTNITLPDGRVVTMSGVNDSDGSINPDIERWGQDGPDTWELLGQKTVPYYPYLHVLPNGLVFRSGPDQQTETFDPATATWAPVAPTIFAGRYEAPSVLLPPTLDRVMLIGGFTGSGQPTSSVEIIDFAATTPQWTNAAHMNSPRMEHNAVILPDGKVLVLGGQLNNGAMEGPALVPEVFDSDSGTWEELAPHQVPRMYHSTAILWPDGRVLLAGADNQPSGEVFSPPYLYRGLRPVINSAPKVMLYETSFNMEFTSASAANTVTLIRMSSVTHSVNMGQRYVRLAELNSGGGKVSVLAPLNANEAPPGYYMLFVVDDDGVPSEARIVRVTTSPTGDFDLDGDVDLADFAVFALCYGGPFNPPALTCPAGADSDIDNDGDVDLADFGQFPLSLTGPF